MSRHLRLILILLCISAAHAFGADQTAIVLDVSESMKTYGFWQVDAKEALSAILAGKPLPNHWEMTPSKADLSSFIAGPQGRVTFIRFGSVHMTSQYPYFEEIKNSLTPSDFADQFPTKVSDYAEAHTNNALAESVAVRMVSDENGVARVLMVSDFLADATPSEQQLAFINEVQSHCAKYTLATLSWVGNPRLQIKLLKFVPVSTPQPLAAPNELGVLHLSPAHYNEHNQALQLAWDYQGSLDPEKYDVRVIDARHGKVLFSKQNLATKSATYSKTVPGPIRWSVMAYLQDGRTVEQSATYNIPDESGSPVAWVVLILVLAALLGTGAFAVRKYGLPDFLKKLKPRPDTDL